MTKKKADKRLMTADRENAYRLLQPFAVDLFNIVSTVQIGLRDCVLFSGDKNRFTAQAVHDLCYINRRAQGAAQTEIFASPYISNWDTGLAVLVAGFFLNYDEATSRGNIATAQRGEGKEQQLTALCEFLLACGFKPTDHATGFVTWKLDVAGTGKRSTVAKDMAKAIKGLDWPAPTEVPPATEKPAREAKIDLVCSEGCSKKVPRRKDPMPIGCRIFAAQEKDWKDASCPVKDCKGTLIPKAKAKAKAKETLAAKAKKAA